MGAAIFVAGSFLAAGACSEFGTASPTAEGGAEDGGMSADADALVDANVAVGIDVVDAAHPCPADAACYGFEDGMTGGVTVTGDCAIVDDVAHSGGHAAHCKGTTRSYFALTRSFPPSAPLSFRAFVRGIPSGGPDAAAVGYVGFLDPALGIPLMMVGDVSTRTYDLWWSTTQGGGFIKSSLADGSPAWTCVEAVFAAPTTLSYFVNGSQVDFDRLDATLGSGSLSFQWGLPYRQTSALAEVFVDDIAIGTSRLGCQ